MSDEELADAVGDVEEFVYGLWLDLGEVRREARRGGRIGQVDGAARCTRRGDGMDAGVARSVIGETLDRLDALRARLADLGERVAAMEDGGDDR